MIYFLSKRNHQQTWRRTIEASFSRDPSIRQELFERIELLSYEELFKLRELPFGAYVFSDLDRLSTQDTERAAIYWQSLASAGPNVRLFNNPITSMRRFELLRNLYECDINFFDVQRLTEPFRLENFPVFIRAESGFCSEAMPLLNNRKELENAIQSIIEAGESRDDKIVIEYIDTRDARGFFAQYSAFVVGSTVIRSFRKYSNNWFIKGVGRPVEELDDELERSVDHESELIRIFRLAGIDFGRADYAVVDGRVQIFEINTNPTIGLVDTLLVIARSMDISSNHGHIPIARRYIPPKVEKEKAGRSFRVARRIHLFSRKAGLLRYEPGLLNFAGAVRRMTRRKRS